MSCQLYGNFHFPFLSTLYSGNFHFPCVVNSVLRKFSFSVSCHLCTTEIFIFHLLSTLNYGNFHLPCLVTSVLRKFSFSVSFCQLCTIWKFSFYVNIWVGWAVTKFYSNRWAHTKISGNQKVKKLHPLAC